MLSSNEELICFEAVRSVLICCFKEHGFHNMEDRIIDIINISIPFDDDKNKTEEVLQFVKQN